MTSTRIFPVRIRARSLTVTALSAMTLALILPAPVSAQQAVDLQEVVVTGTRIKAPNLTAESPVTAIGSEEILQSGTPLLENILNEMPQVHTAQTGNTSNNSTGVANVNLRGLGPTRTLVLIDGRRLGPGDPQNSLGAAADINFIPSAMVTSVDILTGGASAIYGSDAVAGVVNFHMLHNFEGIDFTENYNAAQHTQSGLADGVLQSAPYVYPTPIPGNQFDGFIRDTTLIMGTNTADNRGNITMYGEYRATSPILDGSRDFLSCETGTNSDNTALVCKGSTNTRFGYFITNANKKLSLNPNGTATFVSFPSSGALRENTSPSNYLQRQDDRLSFGAIGHEQFAPWIDVYAEVMFMEDKTAAQVAGGGLFSARGPTGTVTIPCNNAFLSAAQVSSICQDANGKPMPVFQANGQPNVATITMPGLRFTNYPRVDDLQHDDYRAVLGARGTFWDDWSYDVSGTYWDSILSEHYLNDVSFTRVQNALNGCTAAASTGCVPINIFQYGGITPAMFNYISVPGEKTGFSREMTVDANVSGDFARFGGTSPLATNPVATAFGVTYRRDELNFLPDYELQTNDLISQTGGFPPVTGSETVVEEYGELRVPIVEKRNYIEALNLDLALRHSEYTIEHSNSTYATNSYKIAADYAPTQDLRFRGGYNRAARAPNLNELFLPASLTADAGDTDYCSGAKPVATAAACAKTGVTAAQYGNIVECPSGNCYAQQGGNLALKPEEADTWTYGFNLTPTFLPGFNASVDYWDVRVDNYITTLAGNQILQGCLLQGLDNLCGLIHRTPGNGILYGTQGYLVETNQNIGFLHNRGIDMELNYKKSLEDLGVPGGWGAVAFRMTGTYEIESTVSSPNSYNCVGLYGPTCSAGSTYGPNFDWRHNARLTWLTPWDADLSINWRYLSAVKLDTNSSQVNLNGGFYDAADAVIKAYNYFDISAAWRLFDHYTLRLGVNNLMDKDPPFLSHAVVFFNNGGGNENTYTAYDVLGREIFASFNAKF